MELNRVRFDSAWNRKWFFRKAYGRGLVFGYVSRLCVSKKCKSVLDVGGGLGMLGSFLPREIRYDVVDISPKAKGYGEKMFPGSRFITGTIHDVEDCYDAVIGIQVLEHANGYQEIMKSAWAKANKLMAFTFRNGLNRRLDKIALNQKYDNYWENRYSYPRMRDWIKAELSPKRMGLRNIRIRRDYSPEIIMVLEKEKA